MMRPILSFLPFQIDFAMNTAAQDAQTRDGDGMLFRRRWSTTAWRPILAGHGTVGFGLSSILSLSQAFLRHPAFHPESSSLLLYQKPAVAILHPFVDTDWHTSRQSPAVIRDIDNGPIHVIEMVVVRTPSRILIRTRADRWTEGMLLTFRFKI